MLGFIDNSGRWKDQVLKPAVTTMLTSMGEAVAADARERVHVITGFLRDSIGYTVRQSDMTVSIHADAPYAVIEEFGSRYRPAHPYLRPALLAARNWKNRGVNTELHFGGAGPGVRREGVDATGGAKPKGFRNRVGAAFSKKPAVIVHPRHTKPISFRGARG